MAKYDPPLDMRHYVGIDPGAGGGIAVLAANGTVLAVEAMPATERDILDMLMAHGGEGTRAVIELVHSSPQMGKASAFTFGKGYGGLRMALVAACIRFDPVQPQRWQKAMGVVHPKAQHGEKGLAKPRDKNVNKRRAQELFPHVAVTHAKADALLLAEYCRRLEQRIPQPVEATLF